MRYLKLLLKFNLILLEALKPILIRDLFMENVKASFKKRIKYGSNQFLLNKILVNTQILF